MKSFRDGCGNHMPFIPALERRRLEDGEFKANLECIDPVSKQKQKRYSMLTVFSCCFWWDWHLNSGLHTLPLEPHLQSICCSYFGDGVSRTICPGWSWIMIFLISASQVARITDLSHLTQSNYCFKKTISPAYYTYRT
jgi:hypothetical protein